MGFGQSERAQGPIYILKKNKRYFFQIFVPLTHFGKSYFASIYVYFPLVRIHFWIGNTKKLTDLKGQCLGLRIMKSLAKTRQVRRL